MNTYKITKNDDDTYSVESDHMILKHVTAEQLWALLAELDSHITYKKE